MLHFHPNKPVMIHSLLMLLPKMREMIGKNQVRRVRKVCRGAIRASWVAAAIALAGCVTDQSLSLGPASGAPDLALQQASSPQSPTSDAADTQAGVPAITTATIQRNGAVQYYASDEELRLGLEYFNRGDFGLAAQYFQDAVTKAPKDASAWVGLAASYDRLGRFDLSERAYRSAIKLVGDTTAILNNLGYSNMLRGNLVAARGYFRRAREQEPNNPIILNNLKLLNESSRFIDRSHGAF